MATAAELIALAASAPYTPPIDYRRQPLGSIAGEEGLAVPYNSSSEAVVHVRNWSALRKRRILIEGISPQRGGGRAVADKSSPYYQKSVDELHRIAKDEQRDMSWYDMRIAPIIFHLRFDGEQIPIRPDLEEFDVKEIVDGKPVFTVEKQPVWVLIPPGAWDLYMGNYARMRSTAHLERTREMEALQNRGLNRFVLAADNPIGFLEFRREEVRYEVQRIDREKINPNEMIEV